MIVRGFLLAGLVVVIAALAVAFWPEKKKVHTYVPPEDRPYPVRSDWLVTNTLTGVQPTKWYMPGSPPLVLLDRPFDKLTGEEALLVYHVRNRMILDTRKLAKELRDEFAATLTEMFGTFQRPTMPSGEDLIKHLKLDERVARCGSRWRPGVKRLPQHASAATTPTRD